MALTRADRVELARTVVQDHKFRWEQRMPMIRRWKQAYLTDYYSGNTVDKSQMVVATSDAFAFIEGYMASLFSKEPAVEVGSDSQGKGVPDLVKELCNRYLFNKREAVMSAARMALIYQCAFLKMTVIPESKVESVLERMTLSPVPPWECIVDVDANGWDEQRFVGHLYFMPLVEAREKFGAKSWQPVEKDDYFTTSQKATGYNQTSKSKMPDHYLYVQVLELYDLVDDKLLFWSPNWKNGEDLLELSDIPLRNHAELPLIPIAPMYFSRIPDQPMEGMSAIHRVFDQFVEKNTIRSFWANAVRRDSRQYLYRSDVLDEEALAKITAGVDGLMIPVDGTDPLSTLIYEVPSTPISSNHDRYLMQVEQDLSKGSILAPFTRGESTGTTATETAALAQYSASEIGRMARERDSAIERIAEIYIRMLCLFIEDGATAPVIRVDSNPIPVTEEKISGKFRFTALDQAAVPLAKEQRKRQLIDLIPTLAQLGVDSTKIRDELIRLFDLPKTFSEVAKVETPAPSPQTDTIPNQSSQAPVPQQLVDASGGITPEQIRAGSGMVQ